MSHVPVIAGGTGLFTESSVVYFRHDPEIAWFTRHGGEAEWASGLIARPRCRPRWRPLSLSAAALHLLPLPRLPNRGACRNCEVQVERGQMLVIGGGCHDCHTPKKLGPTAPNRTWIGCDGPPRRRKRSQRRSRRRLAARTRIHINGNLTAWSGPWGVTYAANLTPDENTGIGIWTDEMFVTRCRKASTGRRGPILPPMPWNWYGQLPPEDLKPPGVSEVDQADREPRAHAAGPGREAIEAPEGRLTDGAPDCDAGSRRRAGRAFSRPSSCRERTSPSSRLRGRAPPRPRRQHSTQCHDSRSQPRPRPRDRVDRQADTRIRTPGGDWGPVRPRRPVGDTSAVEYAGKQGVHTIQNVGPDPYRLLAVENVKQSGWKWRRRRLDPA